jgi:hypothetical protein
LSRDQTLSLSYTYNDGEHCPSAESNYSQLINKNPKEKMERAEI